MRDESWLYRTRQAWKPELGVALILGSIVARILLPDHVLDSTRALRWLLMPGCQLAAIGLLLCVRCRRCGTSIGWWAATELPASRWYHGFARISACPTCRDRGDGTKEPIEPPPSKLFSDNRWR